MKIIDIAIDAASKNAENNRKAQEYKAKYMKIADSLYGLQATKNGGQGIRAVKDMCTFIRRGEVNEARKVYDWDADKFSNKYPDVDEFICLKLNCKPRYGTKWWKSESRQISYSINSLLEDLKIGVESTVLGIPVARLSKERYWTDNIREGNSISTSEMSTIIIMRTQE